MSRKPAVPRVAMGRKRKTPVTRETDPLVVKLVERAAALGITPFMLSRALDANPSILNRWRTGTVPSVAAIRPYIEYIDAVERGVSVAA